MDATGDDADRGLERFRSYLLLLARVRLDPMVRVKVGTTYGNSPTSWSNS